ncbi:MAG: GatB/YqeY domain-containing protein [Pseudomonadota bacterium]
MCLKERITEEMKSAMRAKASKQLATIRLLLAAIKQKEVDERILLDDTAIIGVIDKMLKQRRDSVTQYAAAGREDLASAERDEIDLLSTYMPARLSAQEIEHAIEHAIQTSGASSANDMGKVMALLKTNLSGRADMTELAKKVKQTLLG